MSIREMIRNEITNTPDTEELIINQKLNKLFYLEEVPTKELQMIKMQYDLKVGDRYGLHASSILGGEKEFCYRQQILSLFYKQIQGQNIPIGLKRIFQEGTSIGEKWQRLFLRGNIGKPEWMDISQFNKQYDLSFTPDAIIELGNKKYVVEIKSQNTFIYKKQNGHPSGMKQLRLYMWLTGIHNGFVLVEDKNCQEFKILPAKHNIKLITPFVERLEQIQFLKKDFITNKKPPKRICKNCYAKRADSCNMKDACFNIGIGRKKL